MKHFTLFILLCAISGTIYGQTVIEGKIVNKKTNEPLPSANIMIVNTNRGTISNAVGQFSLKVEKLPVSLKISFIGYQSEKLIISKKVAQKMHLIELEPVVYEMGTLTVSGGYAANLVEKAVRKALADSSHLIIGEGFYRQLTRSDSVYTGLIETFEKVKLSPVKTEDWKMVQGRYAVVPSDSINVKVLTLKNFSLYSRPTWVQNKKNGNSDLLWPLHTNVSEFYNFQVKHRFKRNNIELTIIHFEPKKNIPKPAFTGTVTIQDSTYAILGLHAKLKLNANVQLLSFPWHRAQARDQKLTIKYASTNIGGYFYPRSVKVDLTYNLIWKKGFFGRLFGHDVKYKQRMHTQSILYFYNYINTYSEKISDGSISGENEVFDIYQIVNKSEYSSKFWKNNPIIKRTPVQQKVIKSFEKHGSFGKMFNNKGDNN